MTIKSKDELERRPVEIDLTGPDGNAYVLMGHAAKWCKQQGRDHKPVMIDMMAGAYNHLLGVFEREFARSSLLAPSGRITPTGRSPRNVIVVYP